MKKTKNTSSWLSGSWLSPWLRQIPHITAKSRHFTRTCDSLFRAQDVEYRLADSSWARLPEVYYTVSRNSVNWHRCCLYKSSSKSKEEVNRLWKRKKREYLVFAAGDSFLSLARAARSATNERETTGNQAAGRCPRSFARQSLC